MSQIEVQGLTLAYNGEAVVSSLDFTVEKGEYVCIVGENGSGKSTLIKALLGTVKPISGTINFDKQSKIGYLSQQTAAQKDFPASVFEVVMSGFAARSGLLPIYSKSLKQRANRFMKLMGVDKLSDKCYRELSGGQQQRVLLTRAFCAAEDILILDEPVSGLDSNAEKELYTVISNFNREGISVIMVTHDLPVAMSYADKILELSHDSFFFGTPTEFLAFSKEKDGAK